MPQKTVKVIVWVCARCDHEWQSKDGEKPVRCSGCKSPYWDREAVKPKAVKPKAKTRKRTPSAAPVLRAPARR